MFQERPNKEILESLSDLVYGHENAKKTIINLINRSKIRAFQKHDVMSSVNDLIPPSKILLVGSSGTGKTHLVESLQQVVHFPLVKVDATKLTVVGASDAGIKNKDLEKLIVKAAEEVLVSHPELYSSLGEAVDRTVVFIDEFDKLTSTYDGGSGNWNKHVQSNFLTLVDNKDIFSSVSWVFAGAFSGMEMNKSAPIGFFDQEQDCCEDFIDDSIIEYGLLPEVVGRLTAIVELDHFTEEDYFNILKYSVLPKKLVHLDYFGVEESSLTDEQLVKMAKGALDSGQGIRYLHRELDKYFLEAEFYYEDFIYDTEI